MQKIQLTNSNEYVLVDAEDFEWLNQYTWHKNMNGYAVFRNKRFSPDNKNKTIYMHRLVNNTPDNYFTDHINQNKLDNRRCNLRTCDKRLNNYNSKTRIDNTSGHRGVSWFPRDSKWRVRVGRKHIGYFNNKQEAIKVYEQTVRKIYA